MDSKELSDLSYSISYWNSEEFETNMASCFPSLIASLDRSDTQKQAMMVVQQIRDRVKKSTVGTVSKLLSRKPICLFP